MILVDWVQRYRFGMASIAGVTISTVSAFGGTTFVDFDAGVGPLSFKASGAGDLIAAEGRAEFTGANVTLLADSGVPQESTGTVSATMTLRPSLDATNPLGLIIVDANDGAVFATALVSSDGLVTLTDWIGNFRNVQFFAPNAEDNTLILEYNTSTERATLTINPGTFDEDSEFLEVALDGANNVSVGVASNGEGNFETFSATGPGILDFPEDSPEPTVTSSGGHGFVEEGDALTLNVQVSGTVPPVTHQWMKDGQPVMDDSPRVTGATTASLTILDAEPGDSGSYQLEFSDAAKAGPFLGPVMPVVIVPMGSLPVGGTPGLIAIALAIAYCGRRTLRRATRARP